ncbi:MAG TPA: patatin-like phospholipase family protein [Bacteroidales bacterium]|nr:patatin-like phospholipase family protein [Bacteroidales bacterium]
MNKKVALVLSSGGSRGLAHIGVIEELLNDGYEIGSISGTSIGSLIGGIYASGNLKAFTEWVCALDEVDIYDLMDFTLTGQGFIKAEKLFKTIENFLTCKTFEELPIPLSVVATDINNRQEIVFDKGNLLLAIRASVAIPSVITPVLYKDMVLVDGGVINPIPANCIKRSEDDLLVVVNVNANTPYQKPDFAAKIRPPREFSFKRKAWNYAKKHFNIFAEDKKVPEGMPGYLTVMDKSIDIMQDRICLLTIIQQRPDIDVKISRDAASTFDFYRAQEIIQAGRDAYKKAKRDFITR